MKKIIIAFVLCLSLSGPSFAQNNIEGMRFLTINALMQYGQKLYDRGDYNEAAAVFNHVLFFDVHQAQALEYIKKMEPPPVDVSDAQSLKQAIEAKKQVIQKLQIQIMQMRAKIAPLQSRRGPAEAVASQLKEE